jgi:hypothetical protein
MVKRVKVRRRRFKMNLKEIDAKCDVQVDAKGRQFVMIFANSCGRRVVEKIFPDVEWTTDDIFSECHSAEWLFTHIRVTRLPPYLESKIPLAFASPDAIGYAVALSIQRQHTMRRVAFYSGEGPNLEVGFFGDIPESDNVDTNLYGDYVPPGTSIVEPTWGSA